MSLGELLACAKPAVAATWAECMEASASEGAGVLFLSACNAKDRAHVVTVRGKAFDEVWRRGAQLLQVWLRKQSTAPIWLRADVVHTVQAMNWKGLQQAFSTTKRNYFRSGIAFDAELSVAMLEQDIGAHAVLYDGKFDEAAPNAANLKLFGKHRYGRELSWPTDPQQPVWVFDTRAVFTDGKEAHRIEHEGVGRGYRRLPAWDLSLIHI